MQFGGAGIRGKRGLAGLAAVLCLALLALASCGQPMPFTQVLPFLHTAPPAQPPSSLYAMTVNDGHLLNEGAWTNSAQIELGARFDSDPKNPSRLEVELEPEDQPLTGAPNIEGQPGQYT